MCNFCKIRLNVEGLQSERIVFKFLLNNREKKLEVNSLSLEQILLYCILYMNMQLLFKKTEIKLRVYTLQEIVSKKSYSLEFLLT